MVRARLDRPLVHLSKSDFRKFKNSRSNNWPNQVASFNSWRLFTPAKMPQTSHPQNLVELHFVEGCRGFLGSLDLPLRNCRSFLDPVPGKVSGFFSSSIRFNYFNFSHDQFCHPRASALPDSVNWVEFPQNEGWTKTYAFSCPSCQNSLDHQEGTALSLKSKLAWGMNQTTPSPNSCSPIQPLQPFSLSKQTSSQSETRVLQRTLAPKNRLSLSGPEIQRMRTKRFEFHICHPSFCIWKVEKQEELRKSTFTWGFFPCFLRSS